MESRRHSTEHARGGPRNTGRPVLRRSGGGAGAAPRGQRRRQQQQQQQQRRQQQQRQQRPQRAGARRRFRAMVEQNVKPFLPQRVGLLVGYRQKH
ncbi:ataxin-2 homolog [Falco rusticolus]|uniref:ataxin-2 homolog n=1 Tax=Falco rusticolus TaxID=120794 RepID=UPI0018869F77|nr:ataxin-2 homolog [Falco rusticolus]XP_055564023.1 ataxin-2 homolog [Falco cherrug]